MRYQIRGLNRASENIQDGISLCQVADGALSETHDILQRINELAVRAANDTLTDSDRGMIQEEVDALKNEIDRIANTTTFNDAIHPLNGKAAGVDGGSLVEVDGKLVFPLAYVQEKTIEARAGSNFVYDGVVYNSNDLVPIHGVTIDGGESILCVISETSLKVLP